MSEQFIVGCIIGMVVGGVSVYVIAALCMIGSEPEDEEND